MTFTPRRRAYGRAHRPPWLLRGTILQPGQTLSVNEVFGPPTAPAPRSDGADSLVATSLFNAEFLAGLKDVEHHPHASLDGPLPGRDGCGGGVPGRRHEVAGRLGGAGLCVAQSTDSAVTVAVLGRTVYDSVQSEVSPPYAVVAPKSVPGRAGAGCTAQDGVAGFQIDVTRVMSKAGQHAVRQVFHTVYAPVDRVVCGGSQGAQAGGSTPKGSATGSGPSGSGPRGGGSPPTGGPSPTGGSSSGGGPTGSPTTDPGLLGGLLGAPAQHR